MLTRREGLIKWASAALASGAFLSESQERSTAEREVQYYPGLLSGSLHVPRYGPALCTDGKRAILSGGAPIGANRNSEHFFSSLLGLVETITPLSLEQRFAANAIFHRANHASVWVDGQAWLLGGRTREGTSGRLVSETERIDLASQAIWRGPDLPTGLIHLAATNIDKSVFVFGGAQRIPGTRRNRPTNSVWECAPPYDAWVERAPIPLAIGNATVTVAEGRAYLIGGYDEDRPHAITQVYDPVADTWSTAAPPPYPLSAHAAAAHEERIFVFGDYTNQSSVLGYDTVSDSWRSLAVPFTRRRHVRAVMVGKSILVAGGNQSSLAPATDAIESYSVGMLGSKFEEADCAQQSGTTSGSAW